jgi:hypothetical protein
MKRALQQTCVTALASLLGLCIGSSAHAEQRRRIQVDQRGDFALIGNTLGWECRVGVAAPIVGQASSSSCGSNTTDTSADLFWRSEEPAAGQATASLAISAAQARSSALLTRTKSASSRKASMSS